MFKLVIPNTLHFGCVSESFLLFRSCSYFILFFFFLSFLLYLLISLLRVVISCIFLFTTSSLFVSFCQKLYFLFQSSSSSFSIFICIFSYRVVTLFLINHYLFIIYCIELYFLTISIEAKTIFPNIQKLTLVCFNGR